MSCIEVSAFVIFVYSGFSFNLLLVHCINCIYSINHIQHVFFTHTHTYLLSPWCSQPCTDDPGVPVAIWDLILTDLNDFWVLPRLPTFLIPPLSLFLFLCVYLDLSLSHTQPISIVLSLTYLSHSLMKQGNRWSVFNEIRVWPALLNHLHRLKSKWVFTLDHADCKAVCSR